jgi:cell shape-determining protein MreC
MPLWACRTPSLQGVGFHFEGAIQEIGQIHEHDLLVTSGLDGVFPPGLFVGTITKIGSLHPGGYSFVLEARPAIAHFHDLETLFILPSQSD